MGMGKSGSQWSAARELKEAEQVWARHQVRTSSVCAERWVHLRVDPVELRWTRAKIQRLFTCG